MGNLLSYAELEQELGVVHTEVFELRKYKKDSEQRFAELEAALIDLSKVSQNHTKDIDYVKSLANGIELQSKILMKNSQNNYRLINQKTTELEQDLQHVRAHSIAQVEKIKQHTTENNTTNPKSPH